MENKKFMKTWLTFTVVFLLCAPVFSSVVKADTIETQHPENLTTADGMDNREKNCDIIELSFDFLKPAIGKNRGYDTVVVSGLHNHGMPGEPTLPFKTVKILLPEGKDVSSINVTASEKIMLDGSFTIEPGQKPVPLMDGIETNKQMSLSSLPYNTILKNKQGRTPPNKTIYSSSESFPGKLYHNLGVQTFRGYRILIVNLYPVQYIPETGEIQYFEEMSIIVETRNAEKHDLFRGLQKDEAIVKTMVDNPKTANTYREKTKKVQCSSFVNSLDSYDYVIITNNALNSSTWAYTFQDLADFKNSKGIATTIVTVENILNESAYWDSNPLFNDTQAVIRNFITDAYMNWGIEYVLLGGDVEIIPHRGFYVDEGLYWDDDIPSDIYYACLDGIFNYDEDSYWGEYSDGPDGDEVDLYAEVYVGRAPVDSEEELSNFVFKTLSYEKSNDPYLRNVQMVGEYLLGVPLTFGGDYKDEIKNGSSNHGYTTAGIPHDYNVSTLYDRDWPGFNQNNPWNTGWPKSEIINIINDGVHIINHIGHANVNYDMKMTNNDVKNLENSKYFFGYSQGCYAGSFDNRKSDGNYISDCIAEDFVTTQNGSFAFIANSRYGWAEAGGTNGPSQHFDREFFDALFGENIRELGKANQDSKEDTVGFISDPVFRWCYYEINLFGDPTVRIKSPVKPEHDIEVRKLDAPRYGLTNETIMVKAGVYNNGQNTENVTVNLIVNSVTVNSTLILNMANDTYQGVWFNWTPTANAVYDLCAYAELVPNENVTDNNMANTTVIVGPDIEVTSISAPGYIELNTTGMINATVTNLGLTDETSIVIDFIVNSTTVDNVSVSILSGESVDVTFNWTPTIEGSYNITIYAEPVADEHFAINNLLSKTILVFAIKGYINVAVVDSWGADNPDSAVWDEINMHWYNYGNYVVSIDYISLNKENITYSDIADSGADVLMISDAWDPGIYNPNCNWEFTDDEIDAINQYINEGHGLVGTGGTLCAYAPNNMKLAPLFGLNPSSVGVWAEGFSQNFNIICQENPLFTKITNPYPTSIPWTVTNLMLNESSPGVKAANSTDDKAMIVEYNNVYASIYFTHLPEFIYRSNKYDRQIVYNAFVWTDMNCNPAHDVAVTFFQAPAYLGIGRNACVSAVIKNNGVSNENVTVNLTLNNTAVNSAEIFLEKNSSQKIVFNWASDVEGEYNIGISASIPNENITTNNFAEKKITVIRTPHASFSPSCFNINITKGDTINKTLVLRNDADATDILEFDIETVPWISASPKNGTIKIGCITNITLTINTTDLETGIHNTNIIISSNDFDESIITIPVCVTVVPNQLPVAVIEGGNRHVDEGDAVALSASMSYDPDTDGSITNYTWDFGDGNKSYSANVSHTYSLYGAYTVILTVKDKWNAIGIDTITVYVNALPRVNVSVAPLEVYTYENVTFNATAYDPDGKIFLYEWDFDGDGTFDWYSTVSGNTTQSYLKCGNYNAAVKVTDNNLTVTVFTVNITVKNRAPAVNFTFSLNSPTTQDSIQFTDASEDLDGVIVSWLWDFGDENTSNEQNPIHRYADDGTYYVNLTVLDDDGETNIAQKSVVVSKGVVVGDVPPAANFTFSPANPTDSEFVYFTDTSTDDGSISSWYWDFGDGNISYEQNPEHKYLLPGTYPVSLTVTDNDGLNSTITIHVQVFLDTDGDGIPDMDDSKLEQEGKPAIIPCFDIFALICAFGLGVLILKRRKKIKT